MSVGYIKGIGIGNDNGGDFDQDLSKCSPVAFCALSTPAGGLGNIGNLFTYSSDFTRWDNVGNAIVERRGVDGPLTGTLADTIESTEIGNQINYTERNFESTTTYYVSFYAQAISASSLNISLDIYGGSSVEFTIDDTWCIYQAEVTSGVSASSGVNIITDAIGNKFAFYLLSASDSKVVPTVTRSQTQETLAGSVTNNTHLANDRIIAKSSINHIDGSVTSRAANVNNSYGHLVNALVQPSISLSTDDSDVDCVILSNDGFRAWACGNENNQVYQYDLTIAGDLNSRGVASMYSFGSFEYGSISKSLNEEYFYIVNRDDDVIVQIITETAGDLDGASTDFLFDYSNETGSARNIVPHPDGYTFLLSANDIDDILEYKTTVKYDLSKAFYTDKAFPIATLDGMFVPICGSKLYSTSTNGNAREYAFKKPWDIDTLYLVDTIALEGRADNIYYDSMLESFYFARRQSSTILIYKDGFKNNGILTRGLELLNTIGFDQNRTTSELGIADVYAASGFITKNLTISTETIEFADANKGWIFRVIDILGNASINNITIDTEGGETISGQVNYIISTDYGSVTLYCNGSNLFVM